MQVIILAAGMGARLGGLTADMPKPALRVGGRPLLDYAIRFARQAGGTHVAVVCGFKRGVTETLARQLGADDVVWNPRFSDAGNLESLETARDFTAGGFLLMNADHIYKPSIAALVAAATAAADQVTGLIDRDRELSADDMKVRVDAEGRITAISKQLETWDAGYVGMTWVPAARVADYFATADNVRREKGDGIHVESVLGRMVGVDGARTADISGHGWLEVDDAQDLARAEAALAADPWY